MTHAQGSVRTEAHPELDVVGLGRCTWDHVVSVEYVPEWDDPKASPVVALAHSGGGPVATAMATLARLGSKVGFIGAVGDDIAGHEIRASFEDEGVDLSHMRALTGERSRSTVVLVHASTGRRSFLAYPGTVGSLSPQETDRSYVTSARFLHLDGDHMPAALEAATWMRGSGGTTVLDAGFLIPGQERLLPLVDVVIASGSFPSLYTGEPDLATASAQLLQLGPKLVVATLSAEGCVCFTEKGGVRVPGFAVEVVDTTGAGDAFHGAFIYGLLQGWETKRTATFANAVAAIKCTALGGRRALPRRDQVEAFIRGYQP
jgi:ribokinase